MQIGIAITTHNRYDVFVKTYEQIVKFLPENALLVVVDDCSDIPVPQATFRFEKQAGIAKAKNKCFELLYKANCDYYFLFDDDIYPIVENWHLPYIESKVNHLCYTFSKAGNISNGNKVLKRRGNILHYSFPCGCMLFYTKICLEKVGGMDIQFGIWGHEHVNLSFRIFNAGLIEYQYLDLDNSHQLFYCLDQRKRIKSSVNANIRSQHINNNQSYHQKMIVSKDYIPFIENKGNAIIITVMNEDCNSNLPYLKNLITETTKRKISLVILTDIKDMSFYAGILPNDVTIVKANFQNGNVLKPLYDYLKANNYQYVFYINYLKVSINNFSFTNGLLCNYLFLSELNSSRFNELLKDSGHSVPQCNLLSNLAQKSGAVSADIIGGNALLVRRFLNGINNTNISNTEIAINYFVFIKNDIAPVKKGKLISGTNNKTKSWFVSIG